MKKEQKTLAYKQLIDRKKLGHAIESKDLSDKTLAPLLDVVSPLFLQNTIYSKTQKFGVPANYNSITIPAISSETGLVGGLLFSIVDSGDAIPLTKTIIIPIELQLSKIAAIIPITNELDEDTAEFLYPSLQTNIGIALEYALDMLILYGDPATSRFTGVFNIAAPATAFIDTAIETTLELQLRAMVSAYYGGPDGKFYVSRTIYDDLIEAVDGITIQAIGEDLFIYNYKVEVSNHMDPTQILLADFTQYAVGQKDIRQDVSDSLYFLTDQLAVKVVMRAGGNTIWDGPLTQEDGALVYPFVTLDTMRDV